MRQISEQELKDILDKHGKWLRNEEGGKKADLRFADLRFAALRSADLRSADLRSADLRSADLLAFQFQQHWAYFTFDGTLRIGCEVLPIAEWQSSFPEIGKKHGYTDLQIKMYGSFISQCADSFKKGDFDAKK